MSPPSRDTGESISNMLNNTLAQSLGSTVEQGMNAREAVMANKDMDWEPSFSEMQFLGKCEHTGEDKWLPSVKGTRTVINGLTGQAIGEVGRSYVGIPNRDAFALADKITGAEIVSCGQWGGGATAYMQLKLTDKSNIVKLLSGIEDVIDQYLLMTTGHTANGNRQTLITPIRVWCKNTLNQALKNKKANLSGVVRHTGDVKGKLNTADNLLTQAGIFFKDMASSFQLLANAEVKDDVVKQYFMDVEKVDRTNEAHWEVVNGRITDQLKGRKRNMVDRYLNAYNGERGGASRDGVRGTLWGAYNAVTYVQDHDVVEEKRNSPTKDATGAIKQSGAERAAHQLFTAGVEVKGRALTEALNIQKTLN